MIRDVIIRMGMKVFGVNVWIIVYVVGNFDWVLNIFEIIELSDYVIVYF